jgi:hypothetical protein
MADTSEIDQNLVQQIKQRMLSDGIDLDEYIGKIWETWPTPPGFRFEYKTPGSGSRLSSTLSQSLNFARTTWVDGSVHPGVQFREVSMDGSLHIVVRDPIGSMGSIHLDRVSIVLDRSSDGSVILKMDNTLQHGATDLMHLPPWLMVKPLPITDGKGGVQVGVQFRF